MTTATEALPGVTGAKSQRSTKRRETRHRLFGYVLVTPYVVALFAFGIGPTIYALYLSLVDDGTGRFLGFWNWGQAVLDYRFTTSVRNVAIYMAIWLPFMMIAALLISLVLQSRTGRFTGFMRMLYYLPGAFTGSASALLWLFIVDPSMGPFRSVLRMFGATYASDVVTTPRLPILFALMAFTSGVGGWIVIMYGALNGVGTEILESAQLDGAGKWRLATEIQLPLIRKYIVYMLIICVSSGLQLYAEPQLLNKLFNVGSTATAPGTTWSINQLALQLGVIEGRIGESSAISLMVLLIGLIAGFFLVFKTDFFDTKELGR